jgi:hypothetical protein
VKGLFLIFLFISAQVFCDEEVIPPVTVTTIVDPVAVRAEILANQTQDFVEISDFQQSVQDKIPHKNVQFVPALPERYDEDAEKAAEDTARLTNEALDFLRKEAGLSPNDCVTVGRGNTGDDGYAVELTKHAEQYDDANSADEFDESEDAPEYTKSNSEWSDHLKTKISEIVTNEFEEQDPPLSPGDAKNWCPNYASMKVEEKTDFWFFLMMGMSYYESNWRPKLTYRESFGPLSSGLFQISKDSASAYGGPCQGITQSELFDAKRNAECSAHMLKELVMGTKNHPNPGHSISAKTDKWIGGSAYWSVLRKAKTKGGILNMIKKNVQSCF